MDRNFDKFLEELHTMDECVNEMARLYFSLYAALQTKGFTKSESLELVKTIIQSNARSN